MSHRAVVGPTSARKLHKQHSRFGMADTTVHSEDILIELASGTHLESNFWTPRKSLNSQGGNKLAICLHPWSWLGGRKDDP